MLRLAADENFNSDIVRGVLRQRPDLDVVRIQAVGLSGADDRTVLEWAAHIAPGAEEQALPPAKLDRQRIAHGERSGQRGSR